MMPPPIPAARVSGLEDLSEWIALAGAKGADRFELWNKVRGTEQQRAHVAAQTEPFEIADELLARVERDARAETGQVAYAVFAFRGKEKTPLERAFVSTPPSAMVTVGSYAATPSAFATAAADPATGPSLALTTVLATMHQMTQEVFATLQRENAHQRNLNESLMRASTGHFDALAKSYERVFGDLTGRHDAALREANDHRSQRRSAEDELARVVEQYKEILDQKTSETAEAERRTKVTSFAGEQLKLLLPVLIAKVAGVPIDAGTIGGAAVGSLLDSLTDEQKAAIVGVLGNEQKIALYEILQTRAQKEATAKKHGAPAAPTPGSEVSASPSTQPPTPTSATGASRAQASPGPGFTADEERAFERLTQLVESPQEQARYEAWLEQKVAREQGTGAPSVPQPPNAPANDTSGASMQTKS
jgi:hypothetical protein